MTTDPTTTSAAPLSPETSAGSSHARLRLAARALCAMLFVAAFAGFLADAWRVRDLRIDDAFITYRFGRRLAENGTLRWNLPTRAAETPPATDSPANTETIRAAEAPVEGYTSFVAVLLSALFIKCGLSPLLAWKALGILLTAGGALAAVWGAAGLLRTNSASREGWGLPWLFGAVWCLPATNAVHAMSGMETILFAALLTTLAAGSLRAVALDRRRNFLLWTLPPGFLLLGMTRPEGVLWACAAASGVALGVPRAERVRFAKALALGFVLPGATYFLWRWAYFGDLLPSTFHAKVAQAGDGGWRAMLPSRWTLQDWLLRGRPWLFAVAAFGVALLFAQRRETTRGDAGRPLLTALCIAAGSLACAAFFAHVHMLMGYAHRFLYPFGQTLWLVLGAPALLAAARARRPALRATALLTLLAAFGLAAWPIARESRKYLTMAAANSTRNGLYREIGAALEALSAKTGEQMTLFHHNMGEPYYYAPHWNSIDPVGLLDRRTAKNGFSADYAFARDPEVLLLPSLSRDRVTEYEAEQSGDVSLTLVEDPRISRYERLGALPFTLGRPPASPTDRSLHLFVRRDVLRRAPEAARRLRNLFARRLAPASTE